MSIPSPYQLLPKSYHSRRWVGVGKEKILRDSGLGAIVEPVEQERFLLVVRCMAFHDDRDYRLGRVGRFRDISWRFIYRMHVRKTTLKVQDKIIFAD